MKKLFFTIFIFSLILYGCQSAPAVQDTTQDNDPTPPQFVIADSQPSVQDSVKKPQQFIKTCVVDGTTYKSVSDAYGYDFDILCNEQSLLKGKEFFGKQLSDWKVCDGNLLFTTNIWLYCYNLADGTIKLISDDVSHFDYFDGYIYFTEHASRTFTIYKTKIGSDKKEVVIGHDVYDKNTPKELVSNFVITDDGNIVFTQRAPWGLFIYKDGKTEMILESTDINERSLCADGYGAYFVMQKTLYVYTEDGGIKDVSMLDDYQNFLYVKNGKCTYLSVDNEIITF